jgi:hypothetical protein
MKILTPYTIVWVVKKDQELKYFIGPLYVDSVRVSSSYKVQVTYHLKSAHSSYTPSREQDAEPYEVFTSFEEAMIQFKKMDFDDTKSMQTCIESNSRNDKEALAKAHKEDMEEESSSSPKRDLIIDK